MSTWVFRYEPDDNGTLLITSDAFPEIATYAEDSDSLYLSALGALEEAVAARIDDGRDLPSPASKSDLGSVGRSDDGSGRFWIKLPTLLQQKAELARLLREAGLNRADLMRRLGWKRESVDRLFRADHATRHAQFDEAFRVLDADADFVVTKRTDGQSYP